MGWWEREISKIATDCGGKLPYLVRYVDDYFGLWEGSLPQFHLFVHTLNSLHPNIKLTSELEADQRISFLDISVTRQQENSFFAISVSRKSCFTGRAMPLPSYCEHKYKLSAIRSAVHRAKLYCNTSFALSKELQFIRKQFRANGYGGRDIERVINSVLFPKFGPKSPPPLKRIGIEFSGPLFYKIQNIAKKHLNIQFVSKSSTSLRSQLFSKVKPRSEKGKTNDCVYSISCDCNKVYVGETGRELSSRVKEHESGWEKGSEKTGFGAHRAHRPAFAEARVLAVERDLRVRLLKEALCIRRAQEEGAAIAAPNDAHINRNPGAMIPDPWLPCLQLLHIR